MTRVDSVLRVLIVGITVEPAFAGLGRRDDRMSGCVRVLGCVTVWRTVAAVGAAALLARPKVNPGAADLDALLAHVPFRMFDCLNGFQMIAGFIAHRAASTRYSSIRLT